MSLFWKKHENLDRPFQDSSKYDLRSENIPKILQTKIWKELRCQEKWSFRVKKRGRSVMFKDFLLTAFI